MAAMTNSDDSKIPDAVGNAGEIIERFGGIRPMATKMNVPVTTVQGWKKRNVIPGNRLGDVMAAARSNNIDLSDRSRDGGCQPEFTFLSFPFPFVCVPGFVFCAAFRFFPGGGRETGLCAGGKRSAQAG